MADKNEKKYLQKNKKNMDVNDNRSKLWARLYSECRLAFPIIINKNGNNPNVSSSERSGFFLYFFTCASKYHQKEGRRGRESSTFHHLCKKSVKETEVLDGRPNIALSIFFLIECLTPRGPTTTLAWDAPLCGILI